MYPDNIEDENKLAYIKCLKELTDLFMTMETNDSDKFYDRLTTIYEEFNQNYLR